MKLFEEVAVPSSSEKYNSLSSELPEHHRPIFEKVLVSSMTNLQLSSLEQFFLAPFVTKDPKGILHIPADEPFIYNMVIHEIAPHFQQIRKVDFGDHIQLMLENPTESSKENFFELMQNRNLNAIVCDLYVGQPVEVVNPFPIKEYHVNLELVPKGIEHDIVSMWSFFERSFIRKNGEMVLLPNGWQFHDSFKDRVAIQAFASVCSAMRINVNTDDQAITSIFVN